jgi:hypothetical protein
MPPFRRRPGSIATRPRLVVTRSERTGTSAARASAVSESSSRNEWQCGQPSRWRSSRSLSTPSSAPMTKTAMSPCHRSHSGREAWMAEWRFDAMDLLRGSPLDADPTRLNGSSSAWTGCTWTDGYGTPPRRRSVPSRRCEAALPISPSIHWSTGPRRSNPFSSAFRPFFGDGHVGPHALDWLRWSTDRPPWFPSGPTEWLPPQ